MTGRLAGTEPGVLLLVPADTYDEPTRCEQLERATVLGDMTCREAQVEFQGSSYPGMVSEAPFTVPPVPAGDYYLAESWENPYTACFVYTSFTVTAPDTAMARPTPPLLLVIAGALLAFGVAAGFRVARLR